MRRIIYSIGLLFTVVFIATMHCNGTGGGTIETTNGIAGSIHNSDDTPAADAVVKLFPSGYNPVTDGELSTECIDTTDAEGNYGFYRITSGTYSVLARNRLAVTGFLTKGIAVNEDSVTTIPMGMLNRSGFISAEFSAGEISSPGYVYIPGTDIVSSVAAGDGRVVLAGVPPGTVDAVIFVNGDDSQRNMLRSEIVVAAGDTTPVERPIWKYRRRLALNTTPSGADVAADVYSFPVLIRLDSTLLDFSQARGDGNDLMFTGSRSTTELPSEIERWDAAAQRAEIWVLVDTVFGNDSTQSITMHWGNPDAPERSGGAGVFDAASGYLGVWHLSGNGNDASTGKNDAVVCTPADAEGMIGRAKRFDGTDSVKIASLMGKPQVVSLSAWAMLDTVVPGSEGAEIVSIGDGCLLRMDDTENDFGVAGSFHLTGANSFYHVYSGRMVENTGWHHCVMVFDCDNHKQSLYIDGALSAVAAGVDSINYTGVGTNTFIGIHGNAKKVYNFIGVIDEVRIRSSIVTEDRVKLEYMNQKAEDALVVFKE
jgi:hypothetical protein